MWHDIKNIFHIIIIFQCLLFAIFLLSQGNNKRQSNSILSAFLFSIIVIEIGGVAAHFIELKNLLIVHFPQLFYLIFPFRFLYVPLLFLYVLSLTKKDFQISKVDNLHFALFFLIFFLFLFKYVGTDSDSLRSHLQTSTLFNNAEGRIYNLIEFIQFFFYCAASLIILKNYIKNIKNHFSSIERINLSWLKFVVLGFIIWKSLLLTDSILWTNFQSLIPRYVYYILYISAEVIFLVFLSLMFLKGLKQPVIFSVNNWNYSKQKYEKILLPDSKKEDYKNRLLQIMETEKPYLDPLIGLQELAKKLSIPSHHLSQLLNTELKQNFFDFINSYRIEESKRMLSENTSNKKTILEILYETGFNSKSVFNTSFKKHTGMTPTQFRKLQNS